MGQTGKRLRTDFQFSFTLFPISHSITLDSAKEIPICELHATRHTDGHHGHLLWRYILKTLLNAPLYSIISSTQIVQGVPGLCTRGLCVEEMHGLKQICVRFV